MPSYHTKNNGLWPNNDFNTVVKGDTKMPEEIPANNRFRAKHT